MSAQLYFFLSCVGSALAGAVLGAWAQAQRTTGMRIRRRVSDGAARNALQIAGASMPRVAGHEPIEGVAHKRKNAGSIEPYLDFAHPQAHEDLVRRISLATRQAVQVELDFHAQSQVRREEARRTQSLRWQSQHEAQLSEIRSLFRSLVAGSPPELSLVHTAPSPGVVDQSSRSIAPMHEAGVRSADNAVHELSDDEIDSLPADLPEVSGPKRRRLTAPKMQPLSRL
jgi:hypothetical protein